MVMMMMMIIIIIIIIIIINIKKLQERATLGTARLPRKVLI